MKEKWFEFVVNNKKHWATGFTARRLQQVKAAVLADEDIMSDLLLRHGASETLPEQMAVSDKAKFNHCINNFSLNILYKMHELKIIK